MDPSSDGHHGEDAPVVGGRNVGHVKSLVKGGDIGA